MLGHSAHTRMVMIVAHRGSTLAACDWVLFVSESTLEASGSHAHLFEVFVCVPRLPRLPHQRFTPGSQSWRSVGPAEPLRSGPCARAGVGTPCGEPRAGFSNGIAERAGIPPSLSQKSRPSPFRNDDANTDSFVRERILPASFFMKKA